MDIKIPTPQTLPTIMLPSASLPPISTMDIKLPSSSFPSVSTMDIKVPSPQTLPAFIPSQPQISLDNIQIDRGFDPRPNFLQLTKDIKLQPQIYPASPDFGISIDQPRKLSTTYIKNIYF